MKGSFLESYQDGYKTTVDLDLQLARRDNEKLGHTDYSHAFIKINKVLYDQNGMKGSFL
jgi:hypothetical protein